jgi:hypothetical protein
MFLCKGEQALSAFNKPLRIQNRKEALTIGI